MRPLAAPLVAAYGALAVWLYHGSFPWEDTVVMVVWFAALLLVVASGRAWRLGRAEGALFWGAALLFPAWEFWVRWVLRHDGPPWSWTWLNRPEHLVWMALTVVVLSPLYRASLERLGFVARLVFVLGLACLVGNANEFFEYAQRAHAGHAERAPYYPDTIVDMLVNVPGGLLGFALLELARLPGRGRAARGEPGVSSD
ncbi:hypothetical protein [Deinococcus pimensis]|uniref:hypothetical protein n=1 Tax=Deinococcus pimensis TaxID=309888 RepID=UPI000481193D|nr:hypothetical protein [Deinococcus pimensis]